MLSSNFYNNRDRSECIKPFKAFVYLGWLLLLFVLFKDFLTAEPFSLDIRVRYVDDIIVVFCYFLGLFYGIKYRNKNVFFVFFYLMFFVLYGLMVSLSLLSSILGVRDYVWYLGLTVLGISSILSRESAGRLVQQIQVWAKFYIIVQVYACILQVLYIVFVKGEFFIEDRLTGTLGYGQAHVLGYSLLLAVAICYRKLSKVYIFLVVACLFVGSVRLGILAMVISFLLVLMVSDIKWKTKLYLVFFGGVSIVTLYFIYNLYQSRATLDIATLIAQHTQEVDYRWAFEGTRKVSMMIFVTSFLETYSDWIFGFGPSSFGSRGAEYMNSPLMIEFDRIFDFDNDLITGGMQWMSTFIEYGIFGVFIWFVFPVALIIFYGKKYSLGVLFAFLVLVIVSFGNRVLDPYAISFFISILILYLYSVRFAGEVK